MGLFSRRGFLAKTAMLGLIANTLGSKSTNASGIKWGNQPTPHVLSPSSSSTTQKVKMRYLGTAGFIVEGDGHILAIDPFVSRPRLREMPFRLKPKRKLIDEVIPHHVDDVLIGHAHYDHVLDAPYLCHRTGARLIGSPSTVNVGRAAGLPECQLVSTNGNEVIESGPSLVKGLPSLHGKILGGRVPLPGNIESPPSWPPKLRELRHGQVLNWYIEIAGLKIVHIDSADFIDEELAGHSADVVCLCAIGRQYRPNYVETVVEKLQPKYIIPCHWDWLFTPYYAKTKYHPKIDLPGFIKEISSLGCTPVVLPFDGEFRI